MSTRLLKGGLWRGTGGVKALRISGAAAATLLPLLQDSVIIRPWAGINIGGPQATAGGSGSNSNVDLRVPGPDQAFTALDIGLANYGEAYQLERLFVGRQGATALTENQATGYVTVVGSPVTIAAGDQKGKTTWVATNLPFAPSPGQNRIRIASKVGPGAPLESYGEFPDRQGIGYVATYQENLAADLASSFNITPAPGNERAYQMPLLVVRFRGLTTSVVTLYMLGDSVTEGFGDGNQPLGRPYGVPGRLEARWRAAGVRIAPVNVGHPGYDTAQYNGVLQQMVADGYDIRVVDRQSDSVNNVVRGKPTGDIRTDLLAAEALIAPQPMIHRLGPGGNNLIEGDAWRAGTVTERTWIKSNRAATVNAGSEVTVTNPGTLNITVGNFYEEPFADVHLNDPGYTQLEADSHVREKEILDVLAGVTL